MKIVVKGDKLTVGNKSYKVAIGSGRFVAEKLKEEGDKKTPCGKFPIREIYYRADKVKLSKKIKIPTKAISKTDAWCDDVKDKKHYNKFVKLPSYKGSCVKLWRDDDLFDVILTIGHN